MRYFVSELGNDSNPGTEKFPFKTLDRVPKDGVPVLIVELEKATVTAKKRALNDIYTMNPIQNLK